MSMYLRFKRKNQTIFIHCEPTDKLQSVKEQLSLIVGKDEDDVRLYELLSDDRRLSLAIQQEKERLAKAAKAPKNPYGNSPLPPPTTSSILADFIQPPLDVERKVSELGLQTDGIVIFVYRIGEGEEWEEMDVDGLVEKKGGAGRRGEEKDEVER